MFVKNKFWLIKERAYTIWVIFSAVCKTLNTMNTKPLLLPLKLHLLIYCTGSLVVGIWWHHHYPWYIAALVWLFGGVLCASERYAQLLNFCIVGLFFFSGALLHHRQQQDFFHVQKATHNKTFDLVGTVTEVQSINNALLRQTLTICVQRMRKQHDTQWHTYPITIQLYLPNNLPLKTGDLVGLADIPFRWREKDDYALYLTKEGVHATLFPKNISYLLLERPSWSLRRFFADKRQQVWRTCKHKLSQKVFALFSLVFLGNKQVNKEYLEDYQLFFKTWGISHHLARSGLHLVILIMVLQLFLGLVPLGYFFKQLFLTLIISMYAFLSWSSISFVRALITFLLYTTCNILQLPIHFIHIVSLVTCVVLMTNPSQLFFLDFQLSFGLTFALAWVNHLQTQRKLHQI